MINSPELASTFPVQRAVNFPAPAWLYFANLKSTSPLGVILHRLAAVSPHVQQGFCAGGFSNFNVNQRALGQVEQEAAGAGAGAALAEAIQEQGLLLAASEALAGFVDHLPMTDLADEAAVALSNRIGRPAESPPPRYPRTARQYFDLLQPDQQRFLAPFMDLVAGPADLDEIWRYRSGTLLRFNRRELADHIRFNGRRWKASDLEPLQIFENTARAITYRQIQMGGWPLPQEMQPEFDEWLADADSIAPSPWHPAPLLAFPQKSAA